MKERIEKVLKELYPYIIIVIVVVLFRTFIATPVRVDGSSMEDTLYNNDILILNKLNKSFDRFDIVVIQKEIGGNKTRLVKRIIGLPGENIKYDNNVLYINDEKQEDVVTARTSNFTLKELYNLDKIPENYYFVMGDNRNNSKDSRDYMVGLISKEDILGVVRLRLFPFSRIGFVE